MAQPNVPDRGMSYVEAAAYVLKRSRGPMTTREITEAAIDLRLIRPRGKTPIATMSAALYVHVRNAEKPVVSRVALPGRTRAQRASVRWTRVR